MNDAIFGAGITLGVAVIGALSALITAALMNRRQQEERHKERLRALYSDVMLAAMRLMPNEFPVRLGRGAQQTTKDEIDVLVSRLRLERWHEGDHIVEELQEVWRAANDWNEHADEPERAMDLIDPLRRRVITSIDSLEDAMRANLGIRPPALGSTFRRRRE